MLEPAKEKWAYELTELVYINSTNCYLIQDPDSKIGPVLLKYSDKKSMFYLEDENKKIVYSTSNPNEMEKYLISRVLILENY